jgi:replicative DNA helicase
MYLKSDLDGTFLVSLMVDPKQLTEIENHIIPDDFVHFIYFEIYALISASVIEEESITWNDLKFKYKDNKEALELIEWMESLKPVDNISLVYEELIEQARLRRIKKLLDVTTSFLKDRVSSIKIIDELTKGINKVGLKEQQSIKNTIDIESTFITSLSERVARFKEAKSNISKAIEMPTGFRSLDELTLGLERKNMWVLGGSTSDGKTQLAIQIANSIMGTGKRILYFMLEDSDDKLFARLISLKSGVPIHSILIGNITDIQLKKIQDVGTLLKQEDKLLVEAETNDINDIIMFIQFAKAKFNDLSLIIVDHINLITDRVSRATNREQEIGLSSKKLIRAAKQFDVAILMLQQLNANPDDRKSGLPVTVNDLRDCKSTGQDAAVTLLLHCPDKYDAEKGFSKTNTQIIVAKNRYGETNKILSFTNHANVGKFIEGYTDKTK